MSQQLIQQPVTKKNQSVQLHKGGKASWRPKKIIMKNLSLEEIKRLESMSRNELIRSFKEYDEYTTHSLALFTNVTTIDKAIYVGIMLKSMKAKEICEETGLTKSHVSRLGKVGKWAIDNKQQYQKLVDTAGTSLSVRAIADAITHGTIKGVKDWKSLVEAEKAYKTSAKATTTSTTKPASNKSSATPAPTTSTTKPASDKATPTTSPAPTSKHAFKIIDFERMNSTAMYSAIIRLCDSYKASGDNIEYMNAFISRLNELKH